MHLLKLLLFICLSFLISSCGGGGSAPFSLTLPTNTLISIDEDNGHTSTFIASTNYSSQITYEIINTTTNGVSELSSNGSYSYQPNQDYFGTDNFSIRITAARVDDNNVTTGETLIQSLPINITIRPVNDPPVIQILDDLSIYTDLSLLFDETLTVKVEITDVDNEISELTFYGQLQDETVNAVLDITQTTENDVVTTNQSLIFNLDTIQNAGLFRMSLCANDLEDFICEGELESYYISNKNLISVTYNCDDDGNNCSSSDQYLYHLIGNPSTDARTNYIFIGDQLNGIDERDEFHLRLLESVNNLKNSDANEVFNDYFNVLVLEEANHTGASIFNIDTGCYASWDARIYCIGKNNKYCF